MSEGFNAAQREAEISELRAKLARARKALGLIAMAKTLGGAHILAHQALSDTTGEKE